MPNLWEIITGNSTLPIAPENTLWDHLNNQQGGGPGGETIYLYLENEIIMESEEFLLEFEQPDEDGTYLYEPENYEFQIEVFEDEDIVVDDNEEEFDVST